MARSKYIYLVRFRGYLIPLAAFTVKREAHRWAVPPAAEAIDNRVWSHPTSVIGPKWTR